MAETYSVSFIVLVASTIIRTVFSFVLQAVQMLRSYSNSCGILVNHIKRIQWMVRGVCKAKKKRYEQNHFWQYETISAVNHSDTCSPVTRSKDIVIHGTPTVVCSFQSAKSARFQRNELADIVQQQERCTKYSQQSIGFAISIYSGFLVSSESYSTRDTIIKIATSAAFFVAIIADLVSWRMKPRWGRALVYISSFHLLLMTFIIFISFDKDYAYPILLVLLITVAAILLQRNIWPAEVCQQSMDDDTAISQDLDFMFDLSSLILNLDSIITMIFTISGHFPSGPHKCESAKIAGFLFFTTIVLSLYLIMVATVRTVALTDSSKYLDVLLMFLLVSALIATSITSINFFDQTLLAELQVPT